MADDVVLSGSGATPPSNTKIVTDEHATRGHMQIVKLAVSDDGSATLIPADSDGLQVKVQAVASPIPVTDNGGSLTIDGTVTIQDGGNVISIDDGAGSITVDGAVTTTLHGAAKGATAAADGTISAVDADHNAVDVYVRGTAYDTSASALLDAADEAVPVSLAGYNGAHVSWSSNTLDGTLVPEVCYETTATNWFPAQFLGQSSGQLSLSFGGDGSNDAAAYVLVWPGSAKHVRVRVSAYASGSITPTVHATVQAPVVPLFTDGTNLITPIVATSAPASDAAGLGVRLIGTSGLGTAIGDDTAFTVGSSNLTPVGGIYRSTLDTVNDGDAGAFAMTPSRFQYVTIGTPDGDLAMSEANNTIYTEAVTVTAVGGQSATDTTTVYTNCTSQAQVDTSSATTLDLVVGVAAKLARICAIVILAGGDTNVTFVEGTTANCAAGQSTLWGPLRLSSSNGRGLTFGNGAGVILDGAAVGNSICVSNGSAQPLNVFARYSIY